MRTVVIGDIHGGYKALKQLINEANLSSDTQYIFIGDYVDGWSESAEVISFLIEFSKTHSCIFLKGNHDLLLLEYLKTAEENPKWLKEGGASSLESYKNLEADIREQHVEFFENLLNFHINSDNRLFLHAGFTNQNGPGYEYYPDMVSWDRTLWEMVCALDPNIKDDDLRFPKRLKLFKEIYIGHTPVTRIGVEKPTNFANVWNVDTGAAFRGPISMLDIDSKEVWQSDPVHLLYPDEKGRN